jgi:hypothetical protein
MAMKSKYNLSSQCYKDIVKLIIDLIPTKHNILKDLYQLKKIVAGLGMNYEMIDMCEKNYILFWKEHKDDIECMHYGRFRYVKVVNEDGASVTTSVSEIVSLHACHSEAQTVVPIRRNNEVDAVTKERET